MSQFEIVGEDGKAYLLDIKVTPKDTTPPTPTGPSFPEGANTVTINGVSYPLAGIDAEDRNPYPGGRGPEELVINTMISPTVYNEWGYTLKVGADNKVISGSATNFSFEVGTEYVISGHHNAGSFLQQAKPGDTVVVTKRVVDPGGGGGTPPTNTTGANTSVWYMSLGDSPKVHLNDGTAELFDEVRLAFTNNSFDPQPGPFGIATFRSELQYLVDKGVRITLSFGGGGYGTSNVVGKVMDAVKRNEDNLQIPIRGVNWDDEGMSFNIATAITQSRAAKNERGDDFFVSWSPDGTVKWLYRDALVQNPDVVDELAFQNYYEGWGMDIVRMALDGFLQGNKLKPEQLGLGMMTGPNSPAVWTLNECKQFATQAKQEYGIRKFFLWELSRQNTREWVQFMNELAAS